MHILIDLILIFALIGSALTFLTGLIILAFKPPRKRGLKIASGSFVAIIAVAVIAGTLQDQRAIEAGFIDAADKRLASEYGYISADEWHQNRKSVVTANKASIDQPTNSDAIENKANIERSEPKQETAKNTGAVQSTEEQTKKSKRFQKNNRMTEAVVSAFRSHHNLEALPIIPNKPLCREDGYCEFTIDEFRMRIYGKGVAEILTTTQTSHSTYREMCSTLFSALSDAGINFAREAIQSAFLAASQAGKFRQDVNLVQINVTPDLNNILACEFFKYGT